MKKAEKKEKDEKVEFDEVVEGETRAIWTVFFFLSVLVIVISLLHLCDINGPMFKAIIMRMSSDLIKGQMIAIQYHILYDFIFLDKPRLR